MTSAAVARTVSGRIAYRSNTGAETGSERFEIVSHPGGHVLRAFCDLASIGLLRDVSIAFDLDWRPIDGFCRIIKAGSVAAASWFCIEPGAAEIEARIAGAGRVHQRLPLDAPLAYLGLHPLQGDALIAMVRGTDDPGRFVAIPALTNSTAPNGDEGLTGTPISIDVAFIGPESVTVTAGHFAARRYALRWRADWPAADLWVRADDGVFLLMRWSMIDEWYELAELRKD
jgi:hypothetical protein